MKSLKSFLLKIIPDSFVRLLYGKILRNLLIFNEYRKDGIRFSIYSDSFQLKKKTEIIGNIIKHYHVIEKGLIMPETRLGFGYLVLEKLIMECLNYVKKFSASDSQLDHAISVILEYEEFHKEKGFELPIEIKNNIGKIKMISSTIKPSKQLFLNSNTYFSSSNSSFDIFSNSRSSVRNYSTADVSLEKIAASLNLARNTPSACNRQSWKTYVFSDKNKINSILSEQGGNRGFGHLANKVIVISGELGVFGHAFERNQVFVDGGMYAMNLLYALHFNKIAACILNCSTTHKKDKRLRALCPVNNSEVFIAIIACGIPPETFSVASSPRYELNVLSTFIDN